MQSNDERREQTLEELVQEHSDRAGGLMVQTEMLALARAVERRTAEKCAQIEEDCYGYCSIRRIYKLEEREPEG